MVLSRHRYGGCAVVLRLFWTSRIVFYEWFRLSEPSEPTWWAVWLSIESHFQVEISKSGFRDNFDCLARSFVSLVITVYSTLHWFLMKENIFVTLGCSYNRTATSKRRATCMPTSQSICCLHCAQECSTRSPGVLHPSPAAPCISEKIEKHCSAQKLDSRAISWPTNWKQATHWLSQNQISGFDVDLTLQRFDFVSSPFRNL